MKTSLRLAAALAAASSFVAARPALAEEGARSGSGGPPAEYTSYLKMKAIDAMHLMDGGNGVVDRDEFLKFHAELFERIDRDHDGKLTPEELIGRAKAR